MPMPWRLVLWVGETVWVVLSGWICICLIVADEIARTLDNGDFLVDGL